VLKPLQRRVAFSSYFTVSLGGSSDRGILFVALQVVEVHAELQGGGWRCEEACASVERLVAWWQLGPRRCIVLLMRAFNIQHEVHRLAAYCGPNRYDFSAALLPSFAALGIFAPVHLRKFFAFNSS
jgi:hypothetical protein